MPYPSDRLLAEFKSICVEAKDAADALTRASNRTWVETDAPETPLLLDVSMPTESFPRNVEGELIALPPMMRSFRDDTAYRARSDGDENWLLAIHTGRAIAPMPNLVTCAIIDRYEDRDVSSKFLDNNFSGKKVVQKIAEGHTIVSWMEASTREEYQAIRDAGKFPQVVTFASVAKDSNKSQKTNYYGLSVIRIFGVTK